MEKVGFAFGRMRGKLYACQLTFKSHKLIIQIMQSEHNVTQANIDRVSLPTDASAQSTEDKTNE